MKKSLGWSFDLCLFQNEKKKTVFCKAGKVNINKTLSTWLKKMRKSYKSSNIIIIIVIL